MWVGKLVVVILAKIKGELSVICRSMPWLPVPVFGPGTFLKSRWIWDGRIVSRETAGDGE
jgi:hypothetical protein